MEILFKPLVKKYPGLQFLLFNYPGQGYTKFNKDCVLNNKYLSECLYKLICHVDISGTNEFITTKTPFYILGIGYGGTIASTFVQSHDMSSLRSLVLLNSINMIDDNISAILHDAMSVFTCSPESRPDLPVYFFSRFIFSNEYIKKVGAPLALNIYTAVHNPISIKARIALCEGILASNNQIETLSNIDIPVILVQSNNDKLVSPIQVQKVLEYRGEEVQTINQCISNRHKTYIIWLKAGHEAFQECKQSLISLIEQLATGYHEKHDVTFLPLGSVDQLALDGVNSQGCYEPQYSQSNRKTSIFIIIIIQKKNYMKIML